MEKKVTESARNSKGEPMLDLLMVLFLSLRLRAFT
jgi:hypothetical protein